MAVTTKGYPYPVGTDRVMDGDDVIHALASAIDKKMPVMGGATLAAGLAAAASTTVVFTYPVGSGFVALPNVQVTAGSSRLTLGVTLPTVTGFTLSISNWSPGALPTSSLQQWVAFSTDAI